VSSERCARRHHLREARQSCDVESRPGEVAADGSLLASGERVAARGVLGEDHPPARLPAVHRHRATTRTGEGERRGADECRCRRCEHSQRRMPVWPSEYRPGCGQTQTPWGPAPTLIRASKRPSLVEIAYTSAL